MATINPTLLVKMTLILRNKIRADLQWSDIQANIGDVLGGFTEEEQAQLTKALKDNSYVNVTQTIVGKIESRLLLAAEQQVNAMLVLGSAATDNEIYIKANDLAPFFELIQVS